MVLILNNLDKKNQFCRKNNGLRRVGMAGSKDWTINKPFENFCYKRRRKVLQKLEVEHGVSGGCMGSVEMMIIVTSRRVCIFEGNDSIERERN